MKVPSVPDSMSGVPPNPDFPKVPRNFQRVLQPDKHSPLECHATESWNAEDFNMKDPLFLRQTVAVAGFSPGSVSTPLTSPFCLGSSPAIPRQLKGLKTTIQLAWLTISTVKISFTELHLACKIQVTAHATFVARNCLFECIDNRCECAVEVFAGSKAEFEGCSFRKNNKAALVVRDRSQALVTNCSFSRSENTSILVLDSSIVTIKNCTFKNAARFSVYLYRSSKGLIERSRFLAQEGKGLFMLKDAVCYLQDCEFRDCNGGAISVADGSAVTAIRTTFNNIKSSCIHGMKNCSVEVDRCIFDTCQGNGVNFEFSKGFVTNCSFRRFSFPAIAVFGPTANPVITDCRVRDCSSIGVVARDASTPVFRRLILDNIGSHGLSLSDYSKPYIEDCLLMRIAKHPYAIFNGSRPVLVRNVVEIDDDPVWAVQTLARPTIAGEILVPDEEKFHGPGVRYLVAHHGGLDDAHFRHNVFLKDGAARGLVFIVDDPASNFGFGADVDNPFALIDAPEDLGQWDDAGHWYRRDSGALEMTLLSEAPPEAAPVEVVAQEAVAEEPVPRGTLPADSSRVVGPGVILGQLPSGRRAEQTPLVLSTTAAEQRARERRTEDAAAPRARPRGQPRRRIWRTRGIELRRLLEGQQPRTAAAPLSMSVDPRRDGGLGHQPPPAQGSARPAPVAQPGYFARSPGSSMGCVAVIPGPRLDLPAYPMPREKHQKEADIAELFRTEIGPESNPPRIVSANCMLCGRAQAKRVYSPCGHLVSCVDCAGRITDGPAEEKFCAVCQTPVQQCTEAYSADVCVICMDFPCDTIILPCGHQCSCYPDASRMWTEKRQCPMCQQRIVSFRHQFPIFE
jgi:hypothetical protein